MLSKMRKKHRIQSIIVSNIELSRKRPVQPNDNPEKPVHSQSNPVCNNIAVSPIDLSLYTIAPSLKHQISQQLGTPPALGSFPLARRPLPLHFHPVISEILPGGISFPLLLFSLSFLLCINLLPNAWQAIPSQSPLRDPSSKSSASQISKQQLQQNFPNLFASFTIPVPQTKQLYLRTQQHTASTDCDHESSSMSQIAPPRLHH